VASTIANSGEINAVTIGTFQSVERSNTCLESNHPQTNGRIGRFYKTFQSKIMYFGSVDVFIIRYNTKRQMPLNWDELETPPIS